VLLLGCREEGMWALGWVSFLGDREQPKCGVFPGDMDPSAYKGLESGNAHRNNGGHPRA